MLLGRWKCYSPVPSGHVGCPFPESSVTETIAAQVQLVVADDAKGALEPQRAGVEPLAVAKGAVPLLWPCLFDYEEIQISSRSGVEVFASAVPVAEASVRARDLHKALLRDAPVVARAAQSLASALKQGGSDGYVGLCPQALLKALRPSQARSYLQQLVQLSDLWEQVRKSGMPWPEVCERLRGIGPEIDAALNHSDHAVVRYYLLGDVPEIDVLEELRIRHGQAEQDVDPEAIAVGEQGLLLGRFEGTWKLMHSGCDADLLGVWAEDGVGFVVGRGGAAAKLSQGRCQAVRLPTSETLNAVWGFGSQSVCVVGERGTVAAFNGQTWQAWPVPSEASLHCVWGNDPDNLFIGGQDAAVMRFDGYNWSRIALPAEGFVSRVLGVADVVYAVGGSRRGGEVYRLDRDGWARQALPPVDWIEGAWVGWDGLGVLPRTGQALAQSEEGWNAEALPIDEVHAVGSGAEALAVGRSGKYGVVVRRDEGAWSVEAAVEGLQIHDVWVKGRPKPPRLSPPPAQQTDRDR